MGNLGNLLGFSYRARISLGLGNHNQEKRGDFQFPINDQTDYKGRITFIARQTEVRPLGNTFKGLIGIEGDTSKAVATRLGRGEQAARALASKAERKIQDAAARGSDNLRTYSASIPQRIGSGRKCVLYLPSSIQFQDRVEYSNVDLGIVGAAAARGLESGVSGSQILKAIGGVAFPDFQSIQDAFNNGLQQEGAQVAALRLAGNISSGVQGAIETTTGIALNPNRRSTLKGVGLRQFRFAFKLIPTSEQEANEIEAIIKFFREEMYPEARAVKGVSAAYRFPSKFHIRMDYDGYRVATGILPAFLESVDVVYNPNAMAFHTRGKPQETEISLSFIEERTLNKDDVANGGF